MSHRAAGTRHLAAPRTFGPSMGRAAPLGTSGGCADTPACVSQLSPPWLATEKLLEAGKERVLMRKGLRALRTGPERSTSGHEGKQPEALVHETTLSPSYPLRPLGWTSFTTPGATKEDRNSTRRMGCCKDTTCLANASSHAHSPSWKTSLGMTIGFPNALPNPRGPTIPWGPRAQLQEQEVR